MPSAICFNLDQSKILLSGNGLRTLRKRSFENIVGKEENATFPIMFSTIPRTYFSFSVTFSLLSAGAIKC